MEAMVGTYKALIWPIINYGAPIWQHLASSSHLDKLAVAQNSSLRIGTGNVEKASQPHLRNEDGVLPMTDLLELSVIEVLSECPADLSSISIGFFKIYSFVNNSSFFQITNVIFGNILASITHQFAYLFVNPHNHNPTLNFIRNTY